MQALLQEDRFAILSPDDMAFICAFDQEMTALGYDFGGKVGKGYCWGRYMIIYTKTSVKNKKVVARIYIRDNGIVLRLFLNGIDKHRAFVENAPAHIKDVFVGDQGKCRHCGKNPDDSCMFRKTYTLEDRFIEKCNGVTFEFHQPSLTKLADYISLFTEFYPVRKRTA